MPRTPGGIVPDEWGISLPIWRLDPRNRNTKMVFLTILRLGAIARSF
jgi:hypothetical protein